MGDFSYFARFGWSQHEQKGHLASKVQKPSNAPIEPGDADGAGRMDVPLTSSGSHAHVCSHPLESPDGRQGIGGEPISKGVVSPYLKGGGRSSAGRRTAT